MGEPKLSSSRLPSATYVSLSLSGSRGAPNFPVLARYVDLQRTSFRFRIAEQRDARAIRLVQPSSPTLKIAAHVPDDATFYVYR